MPKLETLSVSYNKLWELSDEVGQLKKLTKLGVAGNLLTELPVELGNCVMLAGRHQVVFHVPD
jgi:Leucine-rich repeat (LRR) protein